MALDGRLGAARGGAADADLARDLELAVEAAREAGSIARESFRSAHLVDYKTPDQPVTEADVRIDRYLRAKLGTARPEYGWLSEETADSAERLSRRRVWIVDPIDGTSSFILERPEFGVSIGLADEGRAVLGVVLNPVTGELYHAVRGGGAFRDGAPVRVGDAREGGGARVLIASPSELARGDLEPFAADWSILPLGSTVYKMAKVADGTGSAYLSRTRKSEWDVCAAAVLVAEAGGVVLQLDGTEIRFNQPRPRVRGVVCGTPGAVSEILEKIGPEALVPPAERLESP